MIGITITMGATGFKIFGQNNELLRDLTKASYNEIREVSKTISGVLFPNRPKDTSKHEHRQDRQHPDGRRKPTGFRPHRQGANRAA